MTANITAITILKWSINLISQPFVTGIQSKTTFIAVEFNSYTNGSIGISNERDVSDNWHPTFGPYLTQGYAYIGHSETYEIFRLNGSFEYCYIGDVRQMID